jgi:type VI secretion system protein ImpF
MAQLSLHERLQPALFDRLIDEERLLTRYEFTFRRAELRKLGIQERELLGILTAQGLRASDDADDLAPDDDVWRITLTAPAGRVPLAQLKNLTLRPPQAGGQTTSASGTPRMKAHAASATPQSASAQTPATARAPSAAVSTQAHAAPASPTVAARAQAVSTGVASREQAAPSAVALHTLCEITTRNVANSATENTDFKSVSMRRLRDYVCRDLSALLNSASLGAVVDLTAYPHVQSSVLNFGMPSLAGRTARTVDPQQIAATIEAAVRRFEPRLSAVRVTPEMGEDGSETHVLAFRIDAQLWGQPMPQQLVLRTSIDVDSGNVTLADPGGG